MKATLEVQLQPFQTPNFARGVKEKGNRSDGACYPLSVLDPYTLANLCDQFRTEVFKKAGKAQPPEAAPACPKCGC